jgi:hypothetical protein
MKCTQNKVQHWRFHNGIDPVNPGSAYPMVPERGWTCWVFPADNKEFEEWMESNCPGADCTYRFNSGNPMYTVRLTDEVEAMIFKMRWR